MAPIRRKKVKPPPKEVMSPEFKSRYEEVMNDLSKPVSSYTLIYEPYRISKTPGRKKAGKQNDNVIADAFKTFRANPDSTDKKESEKDESNLGTLVPLKSKALVALKSKPEPTEPKKRGTPRKVSEKFPANVRDLTGSGILDGVVVRYVNRTNEVELGGIIKGTGYLCGCASCNYSKTVSADEFENHAGCKTSHSNNHIHLENGKTVHMAVKELLNTPRNVLCDAIHSVLGSLNQQAFSTWKESYQANYCRPDQVSFMPVLVLAAKICPVGMEATLFATLMSISNGGSVVGGLIGAELTQLFGVTNDEFGNLASLIILCNLSSLLPLPLLGLLPQDASDVDSKESINVDIKSN